MSTKELNTYKVNLARNILDENNANNVLDMIVYYQYLKRPDYPCSYSDNEKINRINQSLSDYKKGLGISTEQLLIKHQEWV